MSSMRRGRARGGGPYALRFAMPGEFTFVVLVGLVCGRLIAYTQSARCSALTHCPWYSNTSVGPGFSANSAPTLAGAATDIKNNQVGATTAGEIRAAGG
jgi:hypothetical protein